jgi:hypothetical protein
MPPVVQKEANALSRQVRSLVGLATKLSARIFEPIHGHLTETIWPVWDALRSYELWVVEKTRTLGDTVWNTYTTWSALFSDCKGQVEEAWGTWGVWMAGVKRRAETVWSAWSRKGES